MKSKESEWRVFGVAAFLTVAAFLVMLTGCATARGYPGYDGLPDIPPVTGDNVTLVRITVHNLRTIDATDPMIYVVAGGARNPLGRVSGMGGELNKWIDPAWLGVDGCFTIAAHYAMDPELVFDVFCWTVGERVDATLMDDFHANAMWSHR